MNSYGVPYSGSKSKIAMKIIDFLPPAENFYDLFAGGCAITHAACISGKYTNVYCNDINPQPLQLFMRAIEGGYLNEKRWISKADFDKLKKQDPYIKYCWSFNNNGKNYLYKKENESKIKQKHFEKMARNDYTQLNHLSRTARLNKLILLKEKKINYSFLPYWNVSIRPNSIIYCDIPYRGTTTKAYDCKRFDFERFYEWAENQNELVFISEYSMP